jgi:shikimate kinase
MSKLQDLMEEREPIYRDMADLVVSTEKRNAAVVAREIIKRLNELD